MFYFLWVSEMVLYILIQTGLFISSKARNYFLSKPLKYIFILSLPKTTTIFLYYRNMSLWIINLKLRHLKIKKKIIFKLGWKAPRIPEVSLLSGPHRNPLNYLQVSEHASFPPPGFCACWSSLSRIFQILQFFCQECTIFQTLWQAQK